MPQISKQGPSKRTGTRLQVSISTIFALLILPALGAIIAFSYYQNTINVQGLERRFVDRARDDAESMALNLLEPVAATLRVIAAAEQNKPGFYRSEQSSELLYQALVSAPQIDAVYASFEDGYHRVVTRMDADRRRTDSRIPPRANWHMSFIDAFGPGVKRERHRFFYESWPTRIGEFSLDASSYDVRLLVPQYALARQNGGLAVTDPFINPDTGSPVIALGSDPCRRQARRSCFGAHHPRRPDRLPRRPSGERKQPDDRRRSIWIRSRPSGPDGDGSSRRKSGAIDQPRAVS